MSLNINISQSLPLSPPLELPIRLRLPQGRFGAQRKTPHPTRFHTGVDLHAPIGTKVFPAYGGIVIDARSTSDGREAGDGIIKVLHQPATSEGYITTYAHLDTVSVNVNTFVEIGDELGEVGVSASEQWEPHLHFELRYVALDGMTGLSDTSRNNELRRSSRTMPIDPTRQLYHWELEHYKNENTDSIDGRKVTEKKKIIQIAEITHQHTRYFRVRLKDIKGNFFIPIYNPSADETSLIETLKSSYFFDKPVELAWRVSHFFEEKRVIVEIRI